MPTPCGATSYACHGASWLSRTQDKTTRKRLTACKLRLKSGGAPAIDGAFPHKMKWKHRKNYQRLRSKAEGLEQAIKSYRFQKPLDTRVFRYHVA